MEVQAIGNFSSLLPAEQARGWSEGDVPLEHRGVSLQWLASFVFGLQADSDQRRMRALEQNEQAFFHNRAADRGQHDGPYIAPAPVPAPSVMNVHAFVQHVVKPLTAELRAPLYARVPPQHRGRPEIFISHAWSALLVGPGQQAIGTMDALAGPQPGAVKPTFVWIDFACYNQHLFETVANDMERVIGEIGRIGFAATPIPLLNRSWCLWELLCSERTGTWPEVFVHAGFRNDKILAVNALFRSFAGVAGSRSSSPGDRAAILRAFETRFGSLAAADAHVEQLIAEKLSGPWFELHGRDEDLQFRPYPWLYDQSGQSDPGNSAAREAALGKTWRTFEPYFSDELRNSVLLGSDEPAYATLIGAGLQVAKDEADAYELSHATPATSAAFDAAHDGDVATLERSLGTGLDVNARLLGSTLLHVAANAGQAAAVGWLLKHGADVGQRTHQTLWLPLHMAASKGLIDVATALLDAGSPIDPKGHDGATPLQLAAEKGHLPMVKLLLERGADVAARNQDGWTALFWSAAQGHPDVVDALLAQGAAVRDRAVKMYATPLHLAAVGGHIEVAERLLRAGADVNAQGSNGATPLHYAVQEGRTEMARRLLDLGADPHIATRQPIVLPELARASGMPEDVINRLQ